MVRLYDEREKSFEILGLENVKKYLGEGFKTCINADEIDDKLLDENAGMIGYRCEEIGD